MCSLEIKVECHAGYRGEETPVRSYLGKRCNEVLEALNRWLAPSHCYFTLRGDDQGVNILRHSTYDNVWEMTLFDIGMNEGTRLSST